jgi:hypothetical protein
VPNPLHRAQLVTAAIGVALAVAAVLAVDSDAARATLFVLAASCALLAALLPIITGRLKLGGFEAELRDDIAHVIAEKGSQEGVDPEKIDRLVRSVDQVLARLPSSPSDEQPKRPPPRRSSAGDVMVCADCGVLARLEPPPPQGLGSDAMTRVFGPKCRNCGSTTFRLPE